VTIQNIAGFDYSAVMSTITIIKSKTREILAVYWVLARIIIPISILTELLQRMGAIEAIAPFFAPIMNIVGLPSELGLAWLTAMLVGIWGAVPLIFTLVPVSSLSVADVSVFTALVLFAHGLPIEQKIIQEVGPNIFATTLLRVVGGLLYAFMLHQLLQSTGWLSSAVTPTWVPITSTPDWSQYFFSLAKAMLWMLIILVVLALSLEILKTTGVLNRMMALVRPGLRTAGIEGEAGHLTVVGLFLGISFGAGLLIQEARTGTISPRQIFLSCVFMGFAHSVIEDTLVMMALGADVYAILVGRIIFAIVATAAIAAILPFVTDRAFFAYLFSLKNNNA